MRSILILSTLLLLLQACYERQEGCLDFRASNYEFSADDPCDDCCTFPKLKLSVKHEWGDTTLMSDSIYLNLAQQSIQILESKFYITGLKLTSDGEAATVSELISIDDLEGNEIEISAANALVQTSRFNYELGTFEESSFYDGLAFTVGVDGEFISDGFTTDTDMFDDSTYMYTNFRMEIVTDQIARDTIVFELLGSDLALGLQIDGDVDVPLGVDYTIPLVADYKLLLDDIDLNNITSEEQKNKVRGNFALFFRVE